MQKCLGVPGARGPAMDLALALDHIEIKRKRLAFVGMNGCQFLFPDPQNLSLKR